MPPNWHQIRCSEIWAWVEGNFVFHLFSSSFLKNFALFKNNAEKMKQNKADKVSALRTWVLHFFPIILQSLRSQVVFFKARKIAISIWKERTIGLKKTFNTYTISEKYCAFCSQIPTPFQNQIRLYITVCFVWSFYSLMTLMCMFLTIWKFLQESASSLWKGCKMPSDIKTSCQISRWSSCAYIVLLSK